MAKNPPTLPDPDSPDRRERETLPPRGEDGAGSPSPNSMRTRLGRDLGDRGRISLHDEGLLEEAVSGPAGEDRY
ncbi:MAG: hypothetical protein ACYTFG_01860, partial [Planctomycetota bacterium]